MAIWQSPEEAAPLAPEPVVTPKKTPEEEAADKAAADEKAAEEQAKEYLERKNK